MYKENFSIKKGALKKLEHSVVHDIDEVAKVVEDVAKDAVKVLENAGEDVAFAPLLIFKKTMKEKIAEHGGHDDGTLLSITGAFLKALMSETKPSSFDRMSADTFDKFGFPVAPIFITTPVHLGASAVGVPTSIPGLPDPADVVWGFFHKESNKPGSTTNKIITQAKKDGYGKKTGIAAFFSAPKNWIIIGVVVTVIVVIIVVMATQKKK